MLIERCYHASITGDLRMNEAKSTSNGNARLIKTALKFHVADGSGRMHNKETIPSGNVRTLKEQDLDLVVGRSIN